MGAETRRWWITWLPSFLGFPIGGALAHLLVGPVNDLSAALLSGALAGSVIGAGQAFVLRRSRLSAVSWTAGTAVGLAAGLALGAAAVGYQTGWADLALIGAVSGLVAGAGQALALRGRVPHPWRWALLSSVLWALGWTVTRLVGVDVSEQWAVFGSSGAVVYTVLAGVLLHRFLTRLPDGRRPDAQPEPAPAPARSRS